MTDIQVLHVSSYDKKGGAARAMTRLHAGFTGSDIDSRVLVQIKQGTNSSVIGRDSTVGSALSHARYYINHLPLLPVYLRGGNITGKFTPVWLPDGIGNNAEIERADLIHLHWVAGYLEPGTLVEIDSPLVWTLHDMWPITGGCHYNQECDKFAMTTGCGACPQLDSEAPNDLARRQFKRKRDAWRDCEIHFIAPSEWMADRVRESTLFESPDVTVIPNAINTDFYSPVSRQSACRRFDLPAGKRVLMFGALNSTTDDRKGYTELVEALEFIAAHNDTDDFCIAIFGAEGPLSKDSVLQKFETKNLGFLTDDELVSAYSAADIVVVPSKVESFGQTASEAMACGTPVAAFDTSGLRDIVDHKQTGFLAPPNTPTALAEGIRWLCDDTNRLKTLGENARYRAVRQFSTDVVIAQHQRLYRRLLKD
ncbi:glycosyltransferase family 4 protein [Natrinema halophilum]|uniref:Glycosyltransferase n=1 Tax=Natrinema halophilum TaxID=1699371 RepID=A0A7D5K643_9EURY|nr:glycosyltransferase family 4 protein [Natrinema halophilum]QLG48923.1 glycosyltransferase family 4 protein [Natrinema halophilum]